MVARAPCVVEVSFFNREKEVRVSKKMWCFHLLDFLNILVIIAKTQYKISVLQVLRRHQSVLHALKRHDGCPISIGVWYTFSIYIVFYTQVT